MTWWDTLKLYFTSEPLNEKQLERLARLIKIYRSLALRPLEDNKYLLASYTKGGKTAPLCKIYGNKIKRYDTTKEFNDLGLTEKEYELIEKIIKEIRTILSQT